MCVLHISKGSCLPTQHVFILNSFKASNEVKMENSTEEKVDNDSRGSQISWLCPPNHLERKFARLL